MPTPAGAMPLSTARVQVVFSAAGRFDRTLSPRTRRASRDCGSEDVCSVARPLRSFSARGNDMNNIIYLIGLVVVVVAILGFFGLR
jgi:hypothetical protein